MRSRLLDYDPVTNIRQDFRPISDDECVVHTQQDVTDIVEANKAEMAQAGGRWGDMTKVASIPLSTYFDLQRKGVIDPDGDVQDEKAFLRWLDDPENLHFRTRSGLLSR